MYDNLFIHFLVDGHLGLFPIGGCFAESCYEHLCLLVNTGHIPAGPVPGNCVCRAVRGGHTEFSMDTAKKGFLK